MTVGVLEFSGNRFKPLVSALGRSHKNYWTLYDYVTVPIIDRTATLLSGFKYGVLTAIPSLSDSVPMFDDICDARAQDIYRKARLLDKRIDVFWSGGIDSTAALVALLKNGSKEDIERINVWMSEASIREYPGFYFDHIENRLAVRRLENEFRSVFHSGSIVVTGEIGDQVFGSMKLINKPNVRNPALRTDGELREMKQVGWIDFLWYEMHKILFLVKDRYEFQSFINYLTPQVEKSPIRIKTAFDFLWWLNFSAKYQNVQLRMFGAEINDDVDEDFESKRSRVFHFFDTDDFQRWSIANHDKKIKETIASYKFVAKDYIYTYTKDEDYRDGKIKLPSLSEFSSLDENYKEKHYAFLARSETGIGKVCYGRTSMNPKLFTDKYQNRYDWVFE